VQVEQVVFLAAHRAPEPCTPKPLAAVVVLVATKLVRLAAAVVAAVEQALLAQQE
jgi:hypothetical protein